MTAHLGAERYERGEARRGYRNGSTPRRLVTRVGTLQLAVPQDREDTFSTELFARYQRSEQALVTTFMEMYVQGVSTRKVAAITEELCGASFSKSRRRIRTTNGVERVHQERKRRTRVVLIFPNLESLARLVTALAMEQSDEWVSGRRYLDMNLGEPAQEVQIAEPLETAPG